MNFKKLNELSLKYCKKGRISENPIPTKIITILDKYGELFDLLCVANGKKPLAALDFSNYRGIKILRRKLTTKQKKVANQIIDYANKKGVKCLHNFKRGGMYLKSIFYLPKNKGNALKLMGILWYPYKYIKKSNMIYQISIGLLLGYNKKNIQYFIKTRLDIEISIKEITKINQKLKNIKYTLDELNSYHRIEILDEIKKI